MQGSNTGFSLSHKPKGFLLETLATDQNRTFIRGQVTSGISPDPLLPYKNLYTFSCMDFRSESLALPPSMAQ